MASIGWSAAQGVRQLAYSLSLCSGMSLLFLTATEHFYDGLALVPFVILGASFASVSYALRAIGWSMAYDTKLAITLGISSNALVFSLLGWFEWRYRYPGVFMNVQCLVAIEMGVASFVAIPWLA